MLQTFFMKNQLPETYCHPLPKGLYYDMVLVRAGTFIMGSEQEEAWNDEKPEHFVRLTQDFYIGVNQKCLDKGIVENPLNREGHSHVSRGGSWIDDARDCRVSCRSYWPPTSRDDYIGFRLVLSPKLQWNT